MIFSMIIERQFKQGYLRKIAGIVPLSLAGIHCRQETYALLSRSLATVSAMFLSLLTEFYFSEHLSYPAW
jgi:hypothetical protein